MNNIIIVLIVAGVFLIAERLWPHVELEKVQHWYTRAFAFNAAQAAIAVSTTYLWDVWFARFPLLMLDAWPLAYQVLFGYVTITFI